MQASWFLPLVNEWSLLITTPKEWSHLHCILPENFYNQFDNNLQGKGRFFFYFFCLGGRFVGGGGFDYAYGEY